MIGKITHPMKYLGILMETLIMLVQPLKKTVWDVIVNEEDCFGLIIEVICIDGRE